MNPEIFQSLEFFVLLGPVLLLIALARTLGGTAYRAAMLLASVGLIGVLPGITRWYLVLLLAAALFVFVWLRLMLATGRERNAAAFWMLAVTWLLFFVAVKYEFWARGATLQLVRAALTARLAPIVGFAFLGVRVCSLIADVHSGKTRALPLLEYLLFVFWFPTFLAGPLDRFEPFRASLAEGTAARASGSVYLDNLPRFIIGAFKAFVLAGLLQEHALPFLPEGAIESGARLYEGLIGYYWYEYTNFSGYSDLAIATSRMAGLKVPENFNYPFMATSLTDLWRRWHMTLAGWLRDYIYYPLLFTLTSASGAKTKAARSSLSALSIFITFTLCGLWHGETYGMLFFGISSGLVLGLEAMVTAYFARPAQARIDASPWLRLAYPWAARIVTFHVAIVTFGPVLLSNARFGQLMSALMRKV